MTIKKIIFILLCSVAIFACEEREHIYKVSDYITSDNSSNISPVIATIVADIKREVKQGEKVTIKFDSTTYNFHPQGATTKEYYISNHDQDNPKSIGVDIVGIDNLTIDGAGATLMFHGRMLPIVVSESENSVVKNLSIDFATPHISQATIIENKDGYITYKMSPWSKYKIVEGNLVVYGEGWEHTPRSGIAFEEKTRRVVYRTSDIALGVEDIEELPNGSLRAKWDNPRLIEGTVVAMRGRGRPTPGILLDKNIDTRIENTTIHYAEGMGLLAQLCENITLYKFNVALREGGGRYFTTQADATHFSGCKGEIISTFGLYENMMDDAINVHGTYLKITKRLSDTRFIGEYMHSQAWGFEWGYISDSVQFVSSNTMELIGDKTAIKSIKALDQPTAFGAKKFEIEFTDSVTSEINEEASFGIENLEWTASVIFSDNIIRNNRARGVLFSTPKSVIVERNTFDHTSGTAILLCGDCNGWYETGACLDVLIRDNRFIGSLTNMFQFTNAIISIYPEIPNLKDQIKYFHGGDGAKGIVIENNYFETFDQPILYAKSLNGLVFRGNTIEQKGDYAPFHWNKDRLLFERVINYVIEDNKFSTGFDMAKDIKIVEMQ